MAKVFSIPFHGGHVEVDSEVTGKRHKVTTYAHYVSVSGQRKLAFRFVNGMMYAHILKYVNNDTSRVWTGVMKRNARRYLAKAVRDVASSIHMVWHKVDDQSPVWEEIVNFMDEEHRRVVLTTRAVKDVMDG